MYIHEQSYCIAHHIYARKRKQRKERGQHTHIEHTTQPLWLRKIYFKICNKNLQSLRLRKINSQPLWLRKIYFLFHNKQLRKVNPHVTQNTDGLHAQPWELGMGVEDLLRYTNSPHSCRPSTTQTNTQNTITITDLLGCSQLQRESKNSTAGSTESVVPVIMWWCTTHTTTHNCYKVTPRLTTVTLQLLQGHSTAYNCYISYKVTPGTQGQTNTLLNVWFNAHCIFPKQHHMPSCKLFEISA